MIITDPDSTRFMIFVVNVIWGLGVYKQNGKTCSEYSSYRAGITSCHSVLQTSHHGTNVSGASRNGDRFCYKFPPKPADAIYKQVQATSKCRSIWYNGKDADPQMPLSRKTLAGWEADASWNLAHGGQFISLKHLRHHALLSASPAQKGCCGPKMLLEVQ